MMYFSRIESCYLKEKLLKYDDSKYLWIFSGRLNLTKGGPNGKYLWSYVKVTFYLLI